MHYKKVIPLALTLCSCSPVPAQINDNFSDGNFSSNPNWNGSSDVFIVNPNQELQLNNVTSGQSYLSTPTNSTSLANKEWRIQVKQTFAGSENNHSRIYLSASTADLSYLNGTSGSNTTGYFLKLGEGGSNDAIKFFRDDGPSGIFELGAGTPSSIASSFNINIQVLRDELGNWNVHVDYSGGTNFQQELSVLDNTYVQGNFFGMSCIYTSSNATKFYFDNIYFGNEIPPTVINTPNVRSVVINEIYADPTPSNGLPDAEYIELFNADSLSFELSGWKLVNSNTEKIIPPFTLLPNENVIICDATNAALFPNSIGIATLTALTNAGDSLTLKGLNNEIIDIVSYTDSWYNSNEKSEGGWSIEQINPYKTCSGKSNWTASTNVTGGTPGTANSVFNSTPDVTGPEMLNWHIAEANQIVIHFNESIENSNSSIWNCDNATISTIALTEGNAAVIITFNTNLQSEINYTIHHSTLVDCEGNTAEFSLEIYLGKTPEFGDLIFTEILADPDPVVQGIPAEFVELYNKSSHTLELKGLTLNNAIIEDQFLLAPSTYVVLGDESEALGFLSVTNKILLPSFPTLTNSGMLLKLEMNGTHLDSIRYSSDWYNNSFKANGGWSLELINPNLPCSNSNNWKPCEDEIGNTPSHLNSVYSIQPDEVIPELTYVSLDDSSVILHFNEPVTLEGELLQEETSLGNFIQEIPSTRIILESSELMNSNVHHYSLQNISDCSGNSTSVSFEWGYPIEANNGNLFINEILFNPITNGSDFVELYNPTSECVLLKNISLANEETTSGGISETITSEGRIILPHQHLALTEDGNDLLSIYTTLHPKNIFRVEALPSFNNTSGSCILYSNQNEIIDALQYSESMHFQLLSSFEGISLERLSTEMPTDQSSNWQSASEAAGFATPGVENSQALRIENLTGAFELSPAIFSPDNDGMDDIVQFHFSEMKLGSVGNLTIYNEKGIRVRRLMRNEYLGPEGNIIWDGLSDEGEALAIGIYIATFEAFNKDGIQVKHIRDFILARKL
jgi:hypothetical protein